MSLRAKVIRLAHQNPEMRGHLLPLVKQAVARKQVALVIDDSRGTQDALLYIGYLCGGQQWGPTERGLLDTVGDLQKALKRWTEGFWQSQGEPVFKQTAWGPAYVRAYQLHLKPGTAINNELTPAIEQACRATGAGFTFNRNIFR